MKYLKLLFSVVLAFSTISLANAQSAAAVAGTYKVKLKGKLIKTNQMPVETPFNGATKMIITATGADEIKLEMKGFGGYWSAHIMKGRVGNKRIVASLANGTKSNYTFIGRFVDKKTIEGQFFYVRHGDAASGIVPGWTRAKMRAVR